MAGNSKYLTSPAEIKALQHYAKSLRTLYAQLKADLPYWEQAMTHAGWYASDYDHLVWRLDIVDEFERLDYVSKAFDPKRPFGNISLMRHHWQELEWVTRHLREWKNFPSTAPWNNHERPKIPYFKGRPGGPKNRL